jgi:glycerol-3-phosphate dehydrogenase (NAD(P)+)
MFLVIGAGAWGTALALQLCRIQQLNRTATKVTLWSHKKAHAEKLLKDSVNQKYLPGCLFPQNLNIAHAQSLNLSYLLSQASLVVVATPMYAFHQTLEQLTRCKNPVLWACKGFDHKTGDLAHEIQRKIAPQLEFGVISGPTFAIEVAQGLPTAMVIASPLEKVRVLALKSLHGGGLRLYKSTDVVGVEVGGAVKNVLAIATGLCDGLGLGSNARAALITRGLAEMTRLGLVLGAQVDTFMGLTGLGDLVLTCTGEKSRNRKVGLLLATGQNLSSIVENLGHVAEGVYSADTILKRAHLLKVDMPITHCVVEVLHGRLHPKEAVSKLMEREVKPEF